MESQDNEKPIYAIGEIAGKLGISVETIRLYERQGLIFCIGITSNEQSCTRCHAGYGYSDTKACFSDSLDVDCLACHDNSGTYAKMNEGAGMPDTSVNLSYGAQQLGSPTRTNCGTCYFFGSGGNNVKHGDLEEALFDPTRDTI